jgi:signal transduction histidine kinase
MAERPKAPSDEQKKPELSGIAMKAPLNYLEERFGRHELESFLRETGMDLKYFGEHNNWISFEYAHSIFRRIVELAGDEKVCLEVGRRTVSPEGVGRAAWIAMKAVGNPLMVYKRIFDMAHVYNRVGVFTVLSLSKNRLVLEYRPKEGYYEPDKCFCHYRTGNFEAIPTIWGLPPAKCNQVSCNADGAEACVYEFTWQQKRSYLYPLAGTGFGAILAFLFAKGFHFEDGLGFWVLMALLSASGLLGGHFASLRKLLRQNAEVGREQQEALESSLSSISDKYVELQESNKALEAAHRELTLHKEHLEDLVADRTHELEESKAELEASYEKLEALDKMKMNFFNNISHELRTPLALTLSPVEAMLQGEMGPLEEKQKTYLTNVHTNSLRLLKLINNLLDLAKLEEGKMTLEYGRYSLPDFIQGVVDSFRATGERRGISLAASGTSDMPRVYFDRDKIEKVLINLIGNALKFTPEGGTVSVHWNLETEFARISVHDTGPGIPEDAQDRLFDRFVQADDSGSRKHGGTGIGLSLVKEITELHGGTVEASNRPEGGAVFSFTIPLKEQEITEAEEPAGQQEGWTNSIFRQADYVEEVDRGKGPSNRRLSEEESEASAEEEAVSRTDGPTVLVVEDNKDLREFVADCLSQDFRVVTAVDGQDGWQRVRQTMPDLVVSDIMMPNWNGYQLCSAIKEDLNLKHIPVLLLSSKSEVAMKVEGLEQGADDYLTKPFNPRELVARAKNLIRVRKLENEVQQRNRQLERALLELKEAQSQLIHSEKMASVGMLSAGLVHEVNNPLNAAISSIRTLGASLERLQTGESTPQELSGKLVRASQRALNGLKRCEEIITGLRQFSRKDVEGKKQEDIHQGLDSTLRLLPEEMERKAVIHRDYRFQGKVHCNLGQMNQVFMNLLTNALQSLNGTGEIWVRTEQVGEQILITIEDSGEGISPEVLPRIFEPFFTTKDVGQGTGLGLSISHKVIEEHGGRIQVESVLGSGTRFSIHLPLKDAGATDRDERVEGDSRSATSS